MSLKGATAELALICRTRKQIELLRSISLDTDSGYHLMFTCLSDPLRCYLKRFKRQLLVIFARLRLLSPLLKTLHRWHSHPQHSFVFDTHGLRYRWAMPATMSLSIFKDLMALNCPHYRPRPRSSVSATENLCNWI